MWNQKYGEKNIYYKGFSPKIPIEILKIMTMSPKNRNQTVRL